MKQKLLYITMCVTVILIIACERNGVRKEGNGISALLSWADSNDAEREIKDVRLWIFKADGKLVIEKYFNTKQEIALYIHPLETGDYMVVIAVNLIAPMSADNVSTSTDLIFRLNEASASPAHAHYDVTNVSVSPDKNTNVRLSLRRVLSEFNIEIQGAPEGTTLAAFVDNAADGIHPAQKDEEGSFGQATIGHRNIVTIPEVRTVSGTITTQSMHLMPTVVGSTRSIKGNSHLRFLFTHADGSTMQCDAEAPIMRSSGKYNLKMEYSELKSDMRIEPIKINDWEDGWTISGEIFNPTN